MFYDVTPVTSPHQTDCGATCAKMLLAYYGVDVPLEQLREECHTTITGCTGTDLKRALEAHGLTIHAYNLDAADIYTSDRPGIILWKHGHFVVYCGMDQGKIVIVNPDLGRFHVPKSTFEAFFTNIALFNGEPEEIEVDDEITADEFAEILMGGEGA